MENLSSLYLWLMERRCNEHRTYGKCSCGKKKGKNPCQEAVNLAKRVEDTMNNEDFLTYEDIESFVQKKQCWNKGKCNHRGCIAAGEMLSKVRDYYSRRRHAA